MTDIPLHPNSLTWNRNSIRIIIAISHQNKHRMKRKHDKEGGEVSALAAAEAAAPSGPKKKDKKIKKALKKFASQLVIQASDENWEEHELAKLLALIVAQLGLSSSKLEKFLSSLDCITPMILNGLNDNGFSISSIRMLHMIYNSSHGIAHFQSKMAEALDQDMFTVTDDVFIEEVRLYYYYYDGCFIITSLSLYILYVSS